MSGGGRCNFTNTGTTPANFLSANPHFCKSALARYTPADFIALVERHGIAYHEKELGQLFCDDSSKQIVRMLLDECAAAGVRIETGCAIERVRHGDAGFRARHRARRRSQRRRWSSPAAACRSRAWAPAVSATSSRASSATRVLPTRAGLVPLTLSGTHQERLRRSGRRRAAGRGALQRRALPQLHAVHPSRPQRPGDPADLLVLATRRRPAPRPAAGRRRVRRGCSAQQRRAARQRAEDRARRAPAEALRAAPVRALAREPSRCASTATAELREIADAARALAAGRQRHRRLPHRRGHPGRRRHATSCRRPTMQSKRVPGLYFIGEVVDVTGWLGGYNFQWAWASGHAAAGGLSKGIAPPSGEHRAMPCR